MTTTKIKTRDGKIYETIAAVMFIIATHGTYVMIVEYPSDKLTEINVKDITMIF